MASGKVMSIVGIGITFEDSDSLSIRYTADGLELDTRMKPASVTQIIIH